MIPYVKGWWNNFRATYVGNAQAVRDFRSQLRGTRPLVFWGAYLATLILTATISYGNLVRDGQDFGSSQSALHSVYQILMALLGIVISVAAPALTATAITQERQKRSLDLVACAPITTRYYLIGKMLSSFRYIWMLLILSLPVTSMCVVLGGATWGDVLSSYVLLSASGLVMTSLCLLMSSLFKTGIAALNSAYIFIAGVYLPVTFGISAAAFQGGSLDAPWYGGLSPLLTPMAASTYSSIFGAAIPNYLLVCAFSLFAVRYVLLGTASTMAHYGSNDIRKFRQNSLVVLAAIAASAGSMLHSLNQGNVDPSGNTAPMWLPAVVQIAAPVGMMLIFLTCYLSVHSRSADERFRDDGVWNLRKMWMGTPSSALPYMALVLLSSMGIYAASIFRFFGLQALLLVAGLIAWVVGGVLTGWLISRAVSLRNLAVTQARITSMLLLGAMFAAPSMILTIVGAIRGADLASLDMWKLSIIPIFNGQIDPESLGAQFFFMVIASYICLVKLRAGRSTQATSQTRAAATPSGIPLPVPDEPLFGFEEFAGRKDTDSAKVQSEPRPNPEPPTY